MINNSHNQPIIWLTFKILFRIQSLDEKIRTYHLILCYLKSLLRRIIQVSFQITAIFYSPWRKLYLHRSPGIGFIWIWIKMWDGSKVYHIYIPGKNLTIAGRHIFLCELCRDLRDFGVLELFPRLWKLSKGNILWLYKFEGENSFSMPSSPQFSVGINSQYLKWKEWNRK